MPLEETVAELTFASGLKQNEDEWLQSDGFTTLVNCYQDKDGAITKMPGSSRLADTVNDFRVGVISPAGNIATIGANPRLVRRGSMLGVVNNGYLHARDDRYTCQGYTSPWVADQRSVSERGTDCRIDCCRSGNWVFTAYENGSGDIELAATYLPTGETSLIKRGLSLTGTRPVIRDLDGAGKALLVYLTGANNIVYAVVATDSVTAAATVPGALSGAGLAAGSFDVWTDPASSSVWVVACQNASPFIRHSRCSVAGSVLSSVSAANVAEDTAATACSIAVDKTNNRRMLVWAAWHNNGANYTLRVRQLELQATSDTTLFATATIWSRALTSATAGTAQKDSICLIGVCVTQNAGEWWVTWHDPNTAAFGGEFTTDISTQRSVTVLSGAAFAQADCGWVRMASRPWYRNGKCFVLVAHARSSGIGTDPNSYHAILGLEIGAFTQRLYPFGFFSYLTAPGPLANAADGDVGLTRLSTPYTESDGTTHLQFLERTEAPSQAATVQSRYRIRDAALRVDDRVGRSAELGAATYIVGALLWLWDGVRCVEAAPLQQPYILGPAYTIGALAAGTRYYKVTFARVLASGEVIRSRPSDAVAFTNTGVQYNLIQTNPLTVQASGDFDSSTIYIEYWRTKSGQAGPFYLLYRAPISNTQRDLISFADTVSDATLTTNVVTGQAVPTLYTDNSTGSELANDPPISPVCITSWRNRLWITDGEQVGYTKEAASNRSAEFSGFQLIPNTLPQRITGIGRNGEILAVLSQDAAGYIYGDGPAANGSGSSLVGPVQIAGAIGCTNPAALLEVPQGLLVQTRRGLQLLTQQREWQYVGTPIERIFAATGRLRAAAWDQARELAWFVLTDSGATTGHFVVWDARHNTWSQIYSDWFPSQGHVPTSVLFAGGIFYWADSSGSGQRVYQQLTTATYTVDGTNFAQQIELPWLKLAGAIGEQRVRKLWALLRRTGVGALYLEVGYDYLSSYAFTCTLDYNSLISMEPGETDKPLIRFPSLPRQRCRAWRLRLTEQPASSLDSFTFVALRVALARRATKGALASDASSGSGFA